MQAKQRYCLAATCAVFVIVVFYFLDPVKESQQGQGAISFPKHRRPYSESEDFKYDKTWHTPVRLKRDVWSSDEKPTENCRMDTCFDFSKCKGDFKVYAYPETEKVSQKYAEILSAIRRSRYYTEEPTEACIFILSIDTLDRDVLSKANYVKNMPEKINELKLWNGGLNHVIFNLYSGTWPDYTEDLGFDIGKAMLAKASIAMSNFRPNFDIALPLFHKEHPAMGGGEGLLSANNVPPVRKHTLVFKGKRYLTGIGSETRNSLYHIHNGEDIVLLTTCRHNGNSWRELADSRCDKDNEEYDKFDYKVLMLSSTFCLVPRGRRLGSFRFLEALQTACIPVLLSNGWTLPFSETIDWSKATIQGDERLLLQVPTIVRSIDHAEILRLRQQSQFLWNTYFSSMDKIVATTLEILKDRIYPHLARPAESWNSPPGALVMLPEYSMSLNAFPFYHGNLEQKEEERFTALIYTNTTTKSVISPTLAKLLKHLAKSRYLHKILIVWQCDSPPPIVRWPNLQVPVVVKHIKSLTERFQLHPEIETAAVLSLDDDALLVTDEVDFAFSVWKSFPDRIVGYPPRGHYWDDSRKRWGYTSHRTNHYSMVLTSAAFLHRYYLYLFSNHIGNKTLSVVHKLQNCEDILMNFLVSHVTKLPPIKVTARTIYKDTLKDVLSPPTFTDVRWLQADHFKERQQCMSAFTEHFGYMPLKRSNMRLDPLLFKDAVSISRKKYKQIEHV